MLFVTIGKPKPTSTSKQRIARRVGWNYPTGARVLGEYWLMSTTPALILISESDDASSILSAIAGMG